MAAIDNLRVATRAAAVALQADSSDLTETQIGALTQFIADIDAEAAEETASTVTLKASVASNPPYELRTALEALPVITSALTAAGTHNVAFSYTITASHSPGSFAATGLPTGLTVNTTSGVISGTVTTAGTTSVVVSATNSGGTSATATVVITMA